MRSRLQKAGLWRSDEDSEINISTAWSALSRLGQPARYLGRAQDGLHEYGIIDPVTGHLLATGKGATLESAMCEAALNASAFVKTRAKRPRGLPVNPIPGSGKPSAGQNMQQEVNR